MIPPPLLTRLDRLSLVSRRRPGATLQGERQSRALGSSLEFAEYRGYVPGDDPRRIDWNLYGRSDALFVKQFEAQQMLPVHVLVDASRSMDFGQPNKLHFARQLAAALGCVGLVSFDQVAVGALAHATEPVARVIFGPAWGRVHRAALFAALEGLTPTDDGAPGAATDLALAIASYLHRARRPGLAVLISDLLSPTWANGIQQLLAARNEVVVLHLLAPDELDPTTAEEVRLVDRETGHAVEVRLDRAAIDRYRKRLESWCGAIQSLCARNGIRYQQLSTATPIDQAVLQRLTRGGILR